MTDLSLSDFKDRSYTDNDLDRVMGLMCSKGAVFSSEIAKDLDLDILQVNGIISSLIRSKLAKKLLPDRVYPQPLIKCRISQMWASGVEGYEAFCMRSWTILTLKGVDEYCERHLGQHHQIVKVYVEEYPELFRTYEFPHLIKEGVLLGLKRGDIFK